MIYFRPVDGDAHTAPIKFRPRTCFLMTQIGGKVSNIIKVIREYIIRLLKDWKIETIDANSEVYGKDYLLKIWEMILAVPLGIAIIDKNFSHQTFANIFYEIGLLQAYGKETLVVKTEDTEIPSDFVRTEYLEYNHYFEDKFRKFIGSFFERADYYSVMADQLENNPLLAIAYLKRAYLITGDNNYKMRAKEVFDSAEITGRARNSVEMLLVDFGEDLTSSAKNKHFP